MQIRIVKFSYRFAEQVLNSKLHLKQEIDDILTNPEINLSELSRPNFNKILDNFTLPQKDGKANLLFLKSVGTHLLKWIF